MHEAPRMARLRLYQIDAFTSELFSGNPAAVVPLEEWLDDPTMRAIAAENNLSETAFFVPLGDSFGLRWFTPESEVKLCGHATLATAFVLFNELDPGRAEVQFESLSGELRVRQSGDLLVLDFPRWELHSVPDIPEPLLEGLGHEPRELLRTDSRDNYFAVFDRESIVRGLAPDFGMLATLHPAGVVITAPGDQSDCVSRYFAPSWGVPEDPATGSIHCGLAPYWGERLGKQEILARQASKRGAELYCEVREDRVLIGGHATKYLEGWIEI